MIRYHTFNIGQAGSGAIDLINGHTYFMLDVIPNTDSLLVDVSLKYDSDYQTAKIPNTVPNTFNGGFNLDINGGDPNPSVVTVTSGNVTTTTITGTNGKTIKFTSAISGSDKRLIKIEDFDNKVTDFIYENNLLREVIQGTDKITLDYDDTRLKEVVDITKVGVEILRSGDNFTLRDITDNATPRQAKNTITIARTMSGQNADRAIVTDAQTGAVLDKTFDLNSTREFSREILLIGGVQKQVTIECHSIGFNTDTYVVFCKQDKFNRIPQASDFPTTAAMSDSDLANLLNPNSFLNQTGGYWVITRVNTDQRIKSQHFSPQKTKDAAGQTISRDVAKTFAYSGDNLTSESTIITENGVACPPLVTSYTYTGAKVDEVTAPNRMKTKFIYNKQPQPAPPTIYKMTHLGTHQTGWNSPYYVSTPGGFYFTIKIGSTFIYPNGQHNTATPPTEATHGIHNVYWSTSGKKIYYNISINGRMFSMLEVTVTNSNGNIEVNWADFSNNDDIPPPENTIIYISWFAPSLIKQRPNCDAKATHVKVWHPSNSSEVMIYEVPDDEADDTTGDLNYITPEWKKGLLGKLASGTSQVDYEYDSWGRRSLVKLGQQNTDTVPHVAYHYYDSMNNAYAFYAGGTVFAMHHDNFGKVASIERMTTTTMSEPTLLVNYQYDSEGRLTQVFDINDGLQTTSFQYNELGAAEQIIQGGVTVTSIVNNDGNAEQTTYQVVKRPAQVYKYKYTENFDVFGEIDGTTTQTTKLANVAIETADFDAFGRLRQIQTPIGITDFVYKREPIENNQHKVSSEIESITDIGGTTEYEYYEDGSIKKIKVNNADVAEYDSDDYGRLWHENDIEYEYDTNGNILSKTNLVTESTIEYFYDGNRLMRYNSPVDNFVYDAIGNPTKYRGQPMQWDFKNLRQYQGCGFTYDASGLRKSKTHSNVGIKYHWAGDKLIAETRTTAHTKLLGSYIPQDNLVGGPQSGIYLREDHMYIDYIYGTTGIIGFTLQKNNGAVEKYWYSKNAQGDVTHIYKEAGNTKTLVASYWYDTWGNHAVTVDVDGIGSLNPIRYRGYYYDMETGLYYLKTRYYDPETGRFISPDNINHIHTDIPNGLNLYIYCANNPVNYSDPTGECWLPFHSWCKGVKWVDNNIVQPVVGFVEDNWEIAVTVGVIAGLGALTLLTGGAASPFLVGALIGGGVGAGFGAATSLITGDWSNFGSSVMWGTIGGALSGGFAKLGPAAGSFWQLAGQMGISTGVYVAETLTTGRSLTVGGFAFALIGGFGAGSGLNKHAAASVTGLTNTYKLISDLLLHYNVWLRRLF